MLSAALVIYFTESPSLLQWVLDADRVKCGPNKLTSTTALFNTVTHHLEMADIAIHKRTAIQYNTLFKSHCFMALRLFICTKTTNTSHVVEHLGRAGLQLKTPFDKLHIMVNSWKGISFSVLITVDKTDQAVFTDD